MKNAEWEKANNFFGLIAWLLIWFQPVFAALKATDYKQTKQIKSL